jgi:thiol-disulfide isomerase/thioredoxin
MNLFARTSVKAVGFLFVCLFTSAAWATPSIGVSVEEAYPELAREVLRKARLEKFSNGVVIQTKDIQVDEKFLQKMIQGATPKERPQYEKNLFFFVEQHVLREIVLHEARKAGGKQEGSDEEVIQNYLSQKASGVNVTPQEAEEFYKQNKEAFGGVSFENVKDDLHRYLIEQKGQEAIRSYLRTIGEGMDIRVDEEWAKRQNTLARDNPVDRARTSGKPTMVEFGATGCVPCDMMQPVLENLKKRYHNELNIVFVHVGEEQILGARYGITSIPVQAFFDKTGKEVFRHTGFYAQAEVEKKLAEMGVR